MKKLLVFSHKEVWKSKDSPIGWATDGGFVFHMMAIGTLFEQIELVVPQGVACNKGEVVFKDGQLQISPIKLPKNISGIKRKLFVLLWGVWNIRFLTKKIKKADIVHVPIPSDFGTIGMLLTKWLGKPLFIRHCGNWLAPKTAAEQFWKNFMIKHAGNHVLALATGGGEQLPTQANTAIKWIFSSSLMENELAELAQRAQSKNSNGTLKLVSVARQIKRKGTDKTILAIAELPNQNIHFDVVGDGQDLNYFKQLTKELKLEDRVHFHGKLNNTGVLNVLLQADIFCFPTQSSEGFPKAVIEAMACGLPVITNPVSVLPNLVGGSSSGVILKEGSPKELATVIQEFMTNTKKRTNFSSNALDTASQYSLEKWADLIAQELTNEFKIDFKRKRKLIK